MIWQPIYYVLDFFCSIFLLGLTGNTQPTGLFLMPHTGERAIIYDIPQLHCHLNGARKAERRTRLIGLCRLRRLLGGESKRKEGRKEKKDGSAGGEQGHASRSDQCRWGGGHGWGGCEAVWGKCAEVEGRTQSAADATIVRALRCGVGVQELGG